MYNLVVLPSPVPTFCVSVAWCLISTITFIHEDYYFVVLLGTLLFTHYSYTKRFNWIKSHNSYSLSLMGLFQIKNGASLILKLSADYLFKFYKLRKYSSIKRPIYLIISQ